MEPLRIDKHNNELAQINTALKHVKKSIFDAQNYPFTLNTPNVTFL